MLPEYKEQDEQREEQLKSAAQEKIYEYNKQNTEAGMTEMKGVKHNLPTDPDG